jgi:hypothetical protein
MGLTTLTPSCADRLEIWERQSSWNPQGLSRPVMRLLYLYYYRYKPFKDETYSALYEASVCTEL